jgi:hypothetical protein
MPRKKGKTKNVMAIQAELDCITGALVGWEIAESILRLRINQARQRTGLDELLLPALDELDIMHQRVMAAKSQVSHALGMLTE